ncbi:MAG: ATP-grasp domain-containing protein [Niabella sp.]|nr:MAG: ATP-grasp domain-containing protein [Niabella sp.]
MKKILIANRGEIATRIQQTAKKMNILTVAIYSKADSNAAYVKLADECVLLEGATLQETYLNIEKIIAAALNTNADAIHPGYGFLSENTAFVKACNQAGIIFIGPDAASMNAMGNKIAARKTAVDAGVPVTPGITGSVPELLEKVKSISYPILIKAAAGGGGKGMHIVNKEDELLAALEATAREAKNYFGDDSIYIEKYIENPRHIEVQIMGDKHGNVLHFFERECSLQRRHQKIVEEAPSPTLTPDVRERICTSAVQLAKSIGYVSAGTLEFLLDENLNFYFLEMNTRIQVEHPVTELTTDFDIVEQQIHIANNQAFFFQQEDIKQNGHAIECRIYAEDPAHNFLPSPGKIKYYCEPSSVLDNNTTDDATIRIDGMGLQTGDTVTGDFDPMISKLITWASTREKARAVMLSALEQYHIKGIKTNISFLQGLMRHTDFVQNKISTKYIDHNLSILNSQFLEEKKSSSVLPVLAAGLIKSFENSLNSKNIWTSIGYWRFSKSMEILVDGNQHTLKLIRNNYPEVEFEFENKIYNASMEVKNGINVELKLNNQFYHLNIYEIIPGSYEIGFNGFAYKLIRTDYSAVDNQEFSKSTENINSDPTNIVSPMPGKVIKINVNPGDTIQKGTLLLIVEAMKMENNINATIDAIVEEIAVATGDKVDASTRLIKLKAISLEHKIEI